MKRKLLSILALLLMTATGAWADDSSESFTTNSGAFSYTGEHFKISVDNKGDGDGFFLSESAYARIEALNGEIITKVEFTRGYYDITALRSAVGTTTYEGEVATVSGVNATSLAVNAPDEVQIKAVKVYYTSESSESFTTNSGASSYTGTNVQITVDDEGDEDGFFLMDGEYARIEVSNGYIITKVEFTKGCSDIEDFRSLAGTTTYDGDVATVSDVNATSLTVTGTNGVQIKAVKVYYTTGPATAPIDVTTNEGATGEYWATFYSNAMNYQAPEGTQVFKVNLTGTAIEMTEISNRIVKSGQGVVLKKTASGSITMTPTSSNSSDDYSGNSLVGTMTSITNPGNAYVLNYKAATGAGFYKLKATGTIGANKAYLEYGSGDAPAFFSFGETTGIEAIDNMQSTKDNVVYDLQGRRMEHPTNGIYIVNGKKVFIK